MKSSLTVSVAAWYPRATATPFTKVAGRSAASAGSCSVVLRCIAVFLLLAAIILPGRSSAQTLEGRVLEEGRNTPIPGALVSLVDRDGERKAQAIADSLGRFVLAPPQPGEYMVEAVRLGYQTTRSPLFAMKVEGSVPFDMLMRPRPIGIEGIEVSVKREAEELLRNFGHTPESLGLRWIGPEQIEKTARPGYAGDLIRWQGIPGVYIPPGSTCVTFRRASTIRSVVPPCALTVLNGTVVPLLVAGSIDLHEIEGIAVLQPVDATTFFGTVGGAGAVVIWTRQGRR
jgi:Carboxypeptidase regulatory-like domain